MSHTASLWTRHPHTFLMLLTTRVGGRRAGLPGVLRKWGLGTCYPPLTLFPLIITGPGHVKLRSLAARQLTYRRDTLATSLVEVGDEVFDDKLVLNLTCVRACIYMFTPDQANLYILFLMLIIYLFLGLLVSVSTCLYKCTYTQHIVAHCIHS